MYRQFSVLLLAMLFVVGCSKDKSAAKNDEILKAYRLIDDQRTDEAIELLESSLRKNPNQYDQKVVLASAYAHKAGIKVQKLVKAVQLSKNLKDLKKKLPDQSSRSLAALFMRLSKALSTFNAIPSVSVEQSEYLRHAIEILKSLEDQIRPHDAVYRAVLNIVLFKHIFEQNLFGKGDDDDLASNARCRVDLDLVQSTVKVLGQIMIEVFVDTAYANPKNAKGLDERIKKTEEFVISVSSLSESLTLSNDLSNGYLKSVALESGFGKIIKCMPELH